MLLVLKTVKHLFFQQILIILNAALFINIFNPPPGLH